jgi:hypothetical protein
MAPYACWVHASFKQTLIDACNEFMETNDHGNDKAHLKLITQVAKDITDIAQNNNEALPDDMKKVISNYCGRYIYLMIISVCAQLVWK